MGRNSYSRTQVPSAARTASGNTNDYTAPLGSSARFMLAATAVSGTTPSLTVEIQGKTATGSYVTLNTFTALTAVGDQSIEVDKLPFTYRLAWVISGASPSFTFHVDAVIETID